MNFFQKVKTWSSASYSFIQRLLGILCLFILDNKHMTMIYISTNVWLLYVARLIAGSVIFIFASSLLAQRAGRRERYQILLEASRGYELAEVEALKLRFDAIFPPLGVLDSLMPREVAVAVAPRTIEERIGALEDAVRSLSAEFEQFTFNNVLTNQAPTVQSPTNRAPPIQAPTNRAVPKSWCYYHVRYGKDAHKCSSELCTFLPKAGVTRVDID